MKFLNKTLLILAAGLLSLTAEAADLEIRGNVSYETVNNQQSVRIRVDSVINQSTNATSGTVHLRLVATSTPDLFQNGYILADINFANYANDAGRLGPGQGFSNIDITTPFNRPPDGTYYLHLYVSEFPDISTVDDYITFSNTASWGNTGNNGGGNNGGGNDDHSNSFDSATTAPINASRSGNLEVAGDVDMFRVVIPATGDLKITTSGTTDTTGVLFDAVGMPIASDDDSGNGLNFGFTSAVAPGTYYVGVSGFDGLATGSYVLNVNFASTGNDDPFNNDPISTGGGSGGGGAIGLFGLLLLLPALLRARRRSI